MGFNPFSRFSGMNSALPRASKLDSSRRLALFRFPFSLRQNKLKYHPCELQSKYQVVAAVKGSPAELGLVGNRGVIL